MQQRLVAAGLLALAACSGTPTERIVYVTDCPDGHGGETSATLDQAAAGD